MAYKQNTRPPREPQGLVRVTGRPPLSVGSSSVRRVSQAGGSSYVPGRDFRGAAVVPPCAVCSGRDPHGTWNMDHAMLWRRPFGACTLGMGRIKRTNLSGFQASYDDCWGTGPVCQVVHRLPLVRQFKEKENWLGLTEENSIYSLRFYSVGAQHSMELLPGCCFPSVRCWSCFGPLLRPRSCFLVKTSIGQRT